MIENDYYAVVLNSMGPGCTKLFCILENIRPAARAIQKVNFSNISQQGRTILDVSLLEIDNVCIMTQVGMHGEIYPRPLENTSGLG